MTGQTFGRYRIEQRLGAGGMGTVYRAIDCDLERTVAIKVLDTARLDHRAWDTVIAEARTASALNHPCICTVHEVTELAGRPCIVMEYIEGESLATAIPPAGFPPDLAVQYGMQIADAVAHAHERGVVHRDIKAGNVMLTTDGRVKVLDFGLARRLRESRRQILTETTPSPRLESPVSGTIPYMAPEALEGGAPIAANDIWSMGVLLYEMLTGVLPFRGATSFQIATSIQRDPPAPMEPRVPAGVRAVVLRCLARDISQRYQRTVEVRAALDAVQYAGETAWGGSRPAGWRLPSIVITTAAIGVLTFASISQFAGEAPRGEARPPASNAGVLSVAVLPFINAGGDPELDFLTDGIAQSMISSLSRMPGKLRVTAWSEVLRYRGRDVDSRTVGNTLQVGAVLHGSIVRQENTFTVVMELVRTSDQSHIWGNRYDVKTDELPRWQQDVAGSLSAALEVQLTGEEQRDLARQHTKNADAYLLYLQGQHHWYRLATVEDRRRSLDFFNRAIQLDSAYALAHAGKARALTAMTYEGMLPPSTFAEVKRTAETALSLDETLGAPHEELAMRRFAYEWNWTAAEEEFSVALARSPHDESIHRYYGLFLRTQRRWDDAIASMKRAVDLNPISPETRKALGATYYWAGRSDLAIEQYLKTLELDPTNAQTHDLLADAYAAQGSYVEALESRRRYLVLEGAPEAADALGEDGSEAGYRLAMRRLHTRYLERLQEAAGAPGVYVSPMEFALIYTALGEADRAMSYLQLAYGERSPWIASLAADPAFEPLRSDRRFAEMVKRVGIPANGS